MARYIDAENLTEEIKSLSVSVGGKNVFLQTAKESVLRIIDEQLTADVVEVKHGENIGNVHPVDEFVCSECGIVLEGWTRVVTDEDDGDLFYYEYEFKYCPECGAKMDGERKEKNDFKE